MPKRKSTDVELTETPTKRGRWTPRKIADDELAANGFSDEDEIEEPQSDEPDELADDHFDDQPEAKTPSKRRGRKPAGQETHPENLPPHEKYFWDNRPAGAKTSNNKLPSHLLLNHDEFFNFAESYDDHHQAEVDYLHSLHESSFEQWAFELQNNFNLCLYGYGSKRQLLQDFAEYLYEILPAMAVQNTPKAKPRKKDKPVNEPRIIVVNGFEATISLREILSTIASTLFPSHLKLPTLPSALQSLIIDTLTESPPPQPLYLFINSLDSPALRRATTQAALAALAANPSVHLVATCDTPNFPLLWDITVRRQLRFLFHDCTTFAPYAQEIDVVETVNALLGRSGRRIGGRDGVGYVLKSLPENARNLYRILVAEQVAAGIEGIEAVGDDEDEADAGERNAGAGSTAEGVEYRVLYHKAREELVCSTEHQFRTLLNEFYDHQMLESRRDAVGTERLVVPFRQEELEGLLEDLVGE